MNWLALILLGAILIMVNIIFHHRVNRKYFKKLGEFLLAKNVELD
jgi:hypothetical protein